MLFTAMEVVAPTFGDTASIPALIIGGLIVLITTVLLVKSEKRAIQYYRVFGRAKKEAVRNVQADRYDPSLVHQLVHIVGRTSNANDKPIVDTELGLRFLAMKYRRTVEQYQWHETRGAPHEGQAGGSGFHYHTSWSERHIPSNQFHERTGHENSSNWPFASLELTADRVCLGQAYLLSAQQVEMIDFWLPKHVTRDELRYLPDDLKPHVRIDGKYLYIGQGNNIAPKVGDIRISFSLVHHDQVTVFAEVVANTFKPWTGEEEDLESAPLLAVNGADSKRGSNSSNSGGVAAVQSRARAYTESESNNSAAPTSIFWIDEGTIGFDMMLQRRMTENPLRAVVWRIAAFFALLFGCGVFFWSLLPLFSGTRFFGLLSEGGDALVAGTVGSLLFVLTLAICWMRDRRSLALPALLVALLVLGVLLAIPPLDVEPTG